MTPINKGLVVSGHKEASKAGIEILNKGGNAIDAAIAASAALAVSIPNMNGLGGDSIALWFDQKKNKVITINGSGKSPSKATIKFFKSKKYKKIPRRGPLSISIPGIVHAWDQSLKKYGTKTLKEVLNPAIKLAKNGIKVDKYLKNFFEGSVYKSLIKKKKYLSNIYGDKKKYNVGSKIKQIELANTLIEISRKGSNSFYKGKISKKLIYDLKKQGSIINHKDLKNHKTLVQKAISIKYFGQRIFTAPPNSQGIALLFLCKLFEKNKLNNKNININEFFKLKKESFFYRDKYCIDPKLSKFTKKIFTQKIIKWKKLNNYSNKKVSGDTSTLVVIDKNGNAVSWVQSLFEEFGSGIVSPSTGVVFHNRLYLENLIKTKSNYLRPGKRPFHTLCPAIVLNNNKCDLVIATPGDHGQPQTIYQILHHVYKNNLTIQSAINKPRIRHDSGNQILLEKDFYFKNTNLNIKKYNKPNRIFGGVTAIKRKNNIALSRGVDKRRNCF